MANLTDRNLDFLYQLGSLRHIQRAWRQYFATDVATDLEHTMRVVFTALILAKMEKRGDEEIIMKMAIVHDLAESITGDLTPVQKKYVEIDEERAVEDMFRGTSLEEYIELIARYQKRECIESQMVKDADNLDIDIEMREMADRGHLLPAQWRDGRMKMRDTRLYTESAKEIFDAIQTSNSSAWRIYIEGI